MVLTSDQERVRVLLSDTIMLLCKNGLGFHSQFSVDAVIGITLDQNDVFLVSIRETVRLDSEVNREPVSLDNASHGQDLIRASSFQRFGQNLNSDVSKFIQPRLMMRSSLIQDDNTCRPKSAKRLRRPSREHQEEPATNPMNRYVDTSNISMAIKQEPSEETECVRLQGECTDNSRGVVSHNSTGHSRQTEENNTNHVVEHSSAQYEDSEISSDTHQQDIEIIDGSVKKKPEVISRQQSSSSASVDLTVEGQMTSDGAVAAASNELMLSGKSESLKRRAAMCSDDDTNSVIDPQLSLENLRKLCSPWISHSSSLSLVQSQSSPNDDVKLDTFSPVNELRALGDCNRGKRNKSPKYGNAFPRHFLSGEACSNQNVSGLSDQLLSVNGTGTNHDISVICADAAANKPWDSHAIIDTKVPLSPNDVQVISDEIDSREGKSHYFSPLWMSTSRGRLASSDMNGASHREMDDCATQSVSQSNSTQLPEQLMRELIQTILLYDGPYVPVRDIQRLRLCGSSSGMIRTAMIMLTNLHQGELGSFRELPSGVSLLYKCPPDKVNLSLLESYGIAHDVYHMRFHTLPAPNATNRHCLSYWQRVESNSPYW